MPGLPPGHDFFLIVETDSYEDLLEGFEPILSIGTATIHPVVDMKAKMAQVLDAIS